MYKRQILLVFSFNDAKSLSVFSGFSLKWYYELFRDAETLNALKNTLILAVIASIVSTVMGTAAAVGMNKLRSKYLRAALDTATDIPMMNPDIITGISLMLMFVFFGRLLGATTSLGFWSMLAAHITFCLPYVIMQVLPKLLLQKKRPNLTLSLKKSAQTKSPLSRLFVKQPVLVLSKLNKLLKLLRRPSKKVSLRMQRKLLLLSLKRLALLPKSSN